MASETINHETNVAFKPLDCSAKSLTAALVHNLELLKTIDGKEKVDIIKSRFRKMTFNKLINTCDDVGLRVLYLYETRYNQQHGREKRVKTRPQILKSRYDDQAPGKTNKKEMLRAVPEVPNPDFKKRASVLSKIRPRDEDRDEDEDYVVEQEKRPEKKRREMPRAYPEIPKPDFKKRASVLSKIRPLDEDEDYVEERLPEKIKREKPKAIREIPNPSPESLLEEIKTKVRELEGRDVNYVYGKKLSATDVAPNNNRLSMPKNQIDTSFLTEEEKEFLKKKEGHIPEIKVGLVGPDGEELRTSLKMWEMRNNNFIYNLVENWSKGILVKYKLREGEPIQVWSFRVRQHLWFALVRGS